MSVKTDDNSKKLTARISSRSTDISKEGARAGAKRARSRCPVSNEQKSTHLIDTIAVIQINQYAFDMVAGDPARNISYAMYPEFGTVFQSPQPYMRPGAAHGEKVVKDKLGRLL